MEHKLHEKLYQKKEMGKNKTKTIQEINKIHKFLYFADRGILMTFGSGVYGCLGHGNYNDVAQVPAILFSGTASTHIWN